MDDLDFTEDEISEQLENLGYHDVPRERLQQFKKDLEQMVRHERSWSSSNMTSNADTSDGHAYKQTSMAAPGYRYPLDEASNRPTQTYRLNGSQADHASYGKENLVTGQTYSYRKQEPEPRVPSPTHYHTYNKAAIHIPAPAVDDHYHLDTEYAMYSERPADVSITSTTSSDRRVIKRKVLRKRDGHSEICDESISETDPEVSQLQERLRNLPISVGRPTSARRVAFQSDDVCRRPQSSRHTPCYRLPEDFEGPKALIRPMSANPHTKNIRKTDPVSRYQQYAQSWQAQRAPGEKQHKSLRWSVREQMLYHDEVVEKKQQKSFIPNNYVVPSDKRRKNLRWQIRNDMAQGVIPPSAYD